MAASRALLTFCNFRHFPGHKHRIVHVSTSCTLLNTSSFNPGYSRNPGEVFFRENVQDLLHRITGCDHEKIFRKRKIGAKLETPRYQLLTDEELAEAMAETEEKIKLKLKMPPLLDERDTTVKVLARNPELQGFDSAKYVFTDITPGLTVSKRIVVTRDPDGVLREASWEERQRVCQIYFPTQGKEIRVPKMFEDEHLLACLSRGDYEFILDRACAQFEPDDPVYIRVSRKTYDCINENGHYDALRSTRHFGPMALHLALTRRLDDLLFYFISKEEVGAGADLVRLFHLVERNSVPTEKDEHQLIEDYINKHALKKQPALKLAWETLLEIEKQRLEISSKLNTATN